MTELCDFERENFNPNFETILLTGATGFLGAFLLEHLVSLNTSRTIYCLVRCKQDSEGLERLRCENFVGTFIKLCRSTFAKYKLKWDSTCKGKIVALKGDLSMPKLGLSNNTWSLLSSEVLMLRNWSNTLQVNEIYHCGADLNALLSYKQLKATNVNSTIGTFFKIT
jgi:thioester reductase-like protein